MKYMTKKIYGKFPVKNLQYILRELMMQNTVYTSRRYFYRIFPYSIRTEGEMRLDINNKKVSFSNSISVFSRLLSIEYINKTEKGGNIQIFKAAVIFRYISLIITSVMFLLSNSALNLQQKLIIILIVAVEACIMLFAYSKYLGSSKKIKVIILIETIMNAALLCITGNLSSPFIWYSLNPILGAVLFSKDSFCWTNLSIFLAILFAVLAIFYHMNFYNNFISSYWNIVSILFLLVFGLRQIFKYIEELFRQSMALKSQNKELMELNNKLQLNNKAIVEASSYTMTLYQFVEVITAQKSILELMKAFANYAAKLTKNDKAFFWYLDDNKMHHIEFNNEEVTKNKKDLLAARLYEESQDFKNFQGIINIKILNDEYLLYAIASDSKLYGVIGIKVSNGTENYEFYKKQLNSLMDLGLMAIQRLRFAI